MGRCGDGDPVVRAGDGEGECRIPIPGQHEVGAANAGTEAEHAEATAALDTVLTIAQSEVEKVAAATAAQVIIGSAALEGFVRTGADQDVVTRSADCHHALEQFVAGDAAAIAEFDPVDAVAAAAIAQQQTIAAIIEAEDQFITIGRNLGNFQLLRTIANDRQRVVPAAVLNHVLAIAAHEPVAIVARTAAQLIVAKTASQAVGAGRAEDDVVTAACLIAHRLLNERRRIPTVAVAEDDVRQRPAAQGTDDGDLIARAWESDDQIVAVKSRNADHCVGGEPISKSDDGPGDAVWSFDPVDAVAGSNHHLRIAGKNDPVMATAGLELSGGGKLRGIDPVLGVMA